MAAGGNSRDPHTTVLCTPRRKNNRVRPKVFLFFFELGGWQKQEISRCERPKPSKTSFRKVQKAVSGDDRSRRREA